MNCNLIVSKKLFLGFSFGEISDESRKKIDKTISCLVKATFSLLSASACSILMFQYPMIVVVTLTTPYIIPKKILISIKSVFDRSLRKLFAEWDLMAKVTVLTQATGVNTYIHELGHFFSAKILFQNADPFIGITPSTASGFTQFNSLNLSFFGKILGRNYARMVVTVSGVAFACFISLYSLVSSKEESFLEKYSFSLLSDQVLYGLSSFIIKEKVQSHDFIRLWQFGIHPLVPVSLMILSLYTTYVTCRS